MADSEAEAVADSELLSEPEDVEDSDVDSVTDVLRDGERDDDSVSELDML